MTMIRKILVPVDFSRQSRAAVDQAIVFAQAFGASVEVAHLWHRPTGDNPGAEDTLTAFSESDAGASMKEYLESLESHGVEVRGRLQLAHEGAHKAIVHLADDEGFDLIVLGTHGRTGISHLLHPSTAERVVRTAPCPVLTIRTPDPEGAQVEGSPALVTDA